MNIFKDSGLFKYLNADMIGPSFWQMTIKAVHHLEVTSDRGTERKPVIDFEETDKPLILNVTNARAVARLYGADTDAWTGKAITVYTVEAKGKDGPQRRLRVKEPLPTRARRATSQPLDQAAHGAPPGAGQHEAAQGPEAHGDGLDQGGAGAKVAA